MKLKTILIKLTAIVAVTFIFGACDDDFNSVGSEVMGDVNFQESQYVSKPVAYNKRFERVESSSLPINLLGFYNDPLYKESTYSVVSQLQPSRFSPDFGKNPVLKSVIISLPYFNKLIDTTIEDEIITNVYELDSIYGSNPVKLSIYQSGYFLSDFGTGENQTERQAYYSDDIQSFGPSLEDLPLYTIDEFKPSAQEVIAYTPVDASGTDSEEIKLLPQLRLEFRANSGYLTGNGLDVVGSNYDPDNGIIIVDQNIVNHFQEQILDKAGDIELSNANNFRNYFRGIYFKAEDINGEGNLTFFDMNRARVTLSYVFDKIDTQDDDTTDTVSDTDTFDFIFANNIVNSIDAEFPDDIKKEIDTQHAIFGAENLYLKGGEGSYAVIDLFNKCVDIDTNGDFVTDNDGNPVFIACTGTDDKTELDFLKDRDWLVNNASIKFYVNQDRLGSGGNVEPGMEPERVYLFNPETGGILVDYFADVTANNTINPIGSAINHLGRITRDSDDKGDFYKIILTRHIINVLNGDIENIKLALSVSQNVNVLSSASGFVPASDENDDNGSDDNEEIIPFSSVISHEGTVLYGNGDNVPDDKGLKLDIFYTKSKID